MRRVLAAVVGLAVLCWSWLRGRTIPFGTQTAGWVVGSDYPERAGLAGTGTPTGEMDDLGAYRRGGFDPDTVNPAVREFYEETGAFALATEVRWHRPFRLGAALAAPVTSAVQQLNLPGPFDASRLEMRSRFVDVVDESDPREDVRAWVRTTPGGEAVFVAFYGSHVSDGERFVNVGVPLPGWNLATVLRLEHVDGTAAGTGVVATSRGHGDPGLYAVVPGVGAFALPVRQRFRVWPGDDPDAPEAPVPDGVDAPAVVATHEMWLLGRQFLTVTYGAARSTGVAGDR